MIGIIRRDDNFFFCLTAYVAGTTRDKPAGQSDDARVLNKGHRSSGNQAVTHSQQPCELHIYIKGRYFLENGNRKRNGRTKVTYCCECLAVTISQCHAVTISQCHAVTV